MNLTLRWNHSPSAVQLTDVKRSKTWKHKMKVRLLYHLRAALTNTLSNLYMETWSSLLVSPVYWGEGEGGGSDAVDSFSSGSRVWSQWTQSDWGYTFIHWSETERSGLYCGVIVLSLYSNFFCWINSKLNVRDSKCIISADLWRPQSDPSSESNI